MRIALAVTCVVDVVTPEVGVAAVDVLRRSGCDVTCPLGQTCCGQPAWNSGYSAQAAAVARTTLDALEGALADGADAVVVPAGSCATMIRVFWPELFEVVGDEGAAVRARAVGERTFEFSEFVADRELPPLTAAAPVRVGYHHSCHMLRELRLEEAPEALVDRVSGVERVGWAADDRCCGFGGLFSVKLPEVSVAMADDKLASLHDAGIEVLVGSDSSCLAHLRARAAVTGQTLVTRHVAELVAEALTGHRS